MNEFWNRMILENTVRDWAIALGIMAGIIIVLRFIQFVVIGRLKKFSEKTETTLDDFAISIFQRSGMPLMFLLAVHFGLQYLTLPAKAKSIEHIAIMVAVTFFVLRMISSFASYGFKQILSRQHKNEKSEKQSRGILLIAQTLIWILGGLFLMNNLGYNISTLVAGLGIGGIAIALAAQTILGDLFSYLVIFFDKPFEIGDFIIVDDKMGTVEYIGVKTTRLRTLNGEQLICSNTDLTNSRVHNYKRMQERRIVFSFGVVYQTTASKLKLIPEMTRKIIESVGRVRFDRVHFKSFGDFSLNFEVVYYVLSADYNTYMDIQQSINLKLFEIFEREKIEFAFPTQTIMVNNVQQEAYS